MSAVSIDMNHNIVNQGMSDSDRLKLAQKLDQELDEFINGLEKRQYTEGWPEDRWEEEFNKHPFFMKEAPKVGDELHPLLEGLQQLKFDPAENTAEELAENYKEDGNFNFKHKNYRLAILSYTEGIKQQHNNKILTSMLFNNRSASHFFLKNYRSCIFDCLNCLKLNPDHFKAKLRLAESYFFVENFDKSLEIIDTILFKNPDSLEAQKLRTTVVQAKKVFEKDLRKKNKEKSAENAKTDFILTYVKQRNINLISDNLVPFFPQIQNNKVHICPQTNCLIWPVLILYPEKGQMDFIEEFSENTTLFEQLKEVLKQPAGWDFDFQYKIDTINVYFEQKSAKTIHFVDIQLKLQTILSKKEFYVQDGTPCFYVFVKGSKFENHFLKQYK